jgi:hypothetical protein
MHYHEEINNHTKITKGRITNASLFSSLAFIIFLPLLSFFPLLKSAR